MSVKSQDTLQSSFDKQTYDEYISGNRKYFTIYGATIYKTMSETEIEIFLKDTYKVSILLAKRYIKVYSLENGLIYWPLANQNQEIAYIKDSFLHSTNVLKILEFEKLGSDAEKIVAESFKPRLEWNYHTCTTIPSDLSIYQLHLDRTFQDTIYKKHRNKLIKLSEEIDFIRTKANETNAALFEHADKFTDLDNEFYLKIKSLSEEVEKLKNHYGYTKQSMNTVEESIMNTCKPITISINNCKVKLDTCIDDISCIEKYYEELDSDICEQNLSFDKRLRTVEMFTSATIIGTVIIVAYNVVMTTYYSQNGGVTCPPM